MDKVQKIKEFLEKSSISDKDKFLGMLDKSDEGVIDYVYSLISFSNNNDRKTFIQDHIKKEKEKILRIQKLTEDLEKAADVFERELEEFEEKQSANNLLV